LEDGVEDEEVVTSPSHSPPNENAPGETPEMTPSQDLVLDFAGFGIDLGEDAHPGSEDASRAS
jgi:hypothetical protein